MFYCIYLFFNYLLSEQNQLEDSFDIKSHHPCVFVHAVFFYVAFVVLCWYNVSSKCRWKKLFVLLKTVLSLHLITKFEFDICLHK
jgi:hypothetical protein